MASAAEQNRYALDFVVTDGCDLNIRTSYHPGWASQTRAIGGRRPVRFRIGVVDCPESAISDCHTYITICYSRIRFICRDKGAVRLPLFRNIVPSERLQRRFTNLSGGGVSRVRSTVDGVPPREPKPNSSSGGRSVKGQMSLYSRIRPERWLARKAAVAPRRTNCTDSTEKGRQGAVVIGTRRHGRTVTSTRAPSAIAVPLPLESVREIGRLRGLNRYSSTAVARSPARRNVSTIEADIPPANAPVPRRDGRDSSRRSSPTYGCSLSSRSILRPNTAGIRSNRPRVTPFVRVASRCAVRTSRGRCRPSCGCRCR